MRGGRGVDKRVVFREEHCKSCELCVSVCPKNIIGFRDSLNRQGYRPAFVRDEDQEKCISCALCARMCPDAVIEVFRP
ncbi:MAG TPA: 4Fe-4S dicluster domain-containing protein [Firmicutes bacterium]|nr:4Fe-4S dicluster domain-containing protein [Candidatus Fermentithermobacillaceae bacterium]